MSVKAKSVATYLADCHYRWEWNTETQRQVHRMGYSCAKDCDGWFYAVHIVYRKDGSGPKVKTAVQFRRRWKARDRAYKWYCKATKREFHSLHQHALKGKPSGQDFLFEWLCVVNAGIEDSFDLGVTYLGRHCKQGEKLCLMDKWGKHVVVEASRFEKAEC